MSALIRLREYIGRDNFSLLISKTCEKQQLDISISDRLSAKRPQGAVSGSFNWEEVFDETGVDFGKLHGVVNSKERIFNNPTLAQWA